MNGGYPYIVPKSSSVKVLCPLKKRREFTFNLFIIRNLLFSLWVFMFSIGTHSQTTPTNDSIPPAPRALKIEETSDFGRKTRKLLADTRKLFDKADNLNSIRNGIREMDSLVEQKMVRLNDSAYVAVLESLEREQRQLTIRKNRSTEWNNTVLGWLQEARDKDEGTRRVLLVWSMSRDTLVDQRKQLKEQDTTAVNTITQVMESVRASMDAVATTRQELVQWEKLLENTLSELGIVIGKLDDSQRLLNTRRNALVSDLWVPEHPPIWKMGRDTTQSRQPSILEHIEGDYIIVKGYYRNHPKLPYRTLFAFLFVFGTLLYLRSRVNKFYTRFEGQVQDAMIVTRFPLLSSLIILWFWAYLAYDLPQELNRFISIVMIIPLSLMLWHLVRQHKKRTVTVFFCVYLLYILIPSIAEATYTLRIVLLLIDSGLLIALLWLRKQRKMVEEANAFWLGTLRFLNSLFILFISISFISNIIGSVELAQLLTYSTLGIYLSFVIIRQAIHLSRSLIFLLVLGPWYRYSNILKEDSDKVLKNLDKGLTVVGFLTWAGASLNLLKLRETVASGIWSFINYPIEVGELSISLGNVLAFYIILQISIWLSSFIRYFLEKEVYPRVHLREGVPSTISLLVRYTLAVVGFILALAGAGIELSQFAVAIGALGVGIGFGLQNIVNNFISGIILALERPIKIGDVVQIDDVSGVVKDIGLRASQVTTWDGSDVLVPNGDLISNKLTNWTFHNRRRRSKVDVRVPFDSDIQAVSKLVIEAAIAVPDVLKKPGPYLNFRGIGQSAMEIDLYFWMGNVDNVFSMGTAVRTAVYKALLEAGYEIPVPKQDIKLNKETESIKD